MPLCPAWSVQIKTIPPERAGCVPWCFPQAGRVGVERDTLGAARGPRPVHRGGRGAAAPELRGRPVVVGGDGDPTKRGVVSTASYEAREYGVHSGLPLRTAAKRLPDAVFLPVDRAAYEEISETVMAVLRSTGAVVEVLGWDEAFVGVDADDPEAFARSLRAASWRRHNLDCTVGIGENKLQAKIATGFEVAGVFRPTFANWFEVLGGLAHQRAVGHRRQDGQEAGRTGHPHRQRPGRGGPGRTGHGVRTDDRAVAGAAGPGPGRRRGGRHAVRGPRPRPGGDLSAEHRRLVRSPGRGDADRRVAGGGSGSRSPDPRCGWW